MQISRALSHHATPRPNLQKTVATPQTGATPAKSGARAVGAEPLDALKSKYDMRNISPREVDQLVDSLLETGETPNGEMMMLMTFGEKFSEGLQEVTGHARDPNQRLNLFEITASSIRFNRAAGHDTKALESFQSFLSGFSQRRVSTYA